MNESNQGAFLEATLDEQEATLVDQSIPGKLKSP